MTPDHDDAKLDQLLERAREIVKRNQSPLLVESAMEGRVVELAAKEIGLKDGGR